MRNDNTPNVVRRIFNEYLADEGMHTIAKILTAKRVLTPAQVANKSNSSSSWHESTIKKILNNHHYAEISYTTGQRQLQSLQIKGVRAILRT